MKVSTVNRASKTRDSALVWLGLVYVACIVVVHLYVLAGPTFQAQLRMRPQKSLHAFADVAALLHGETALTLVLISSYGGLCVAYLWGFSRLRYDTISQRAIFLWAVLFAILLVPLLPHFSSDIVAYVRQGQVLAVYHSNPYLHTPAEIADPGLIYRSAGSYWVSPYGPLATVLSAAAAELGGRSLALTAGILKLLMAACYLLSGWMVGKILDCIDPSATRRGLFFFLWNPLVLLELVGQGHNEAIVIGLMMVGFYLTVRQKQTSGFLFLFLSALAKVTTLVILPLEAWLMLRRRAYRVLIQNTLFSLLVAFICWLLFFRDPRSFKELSAVSQQAWCSLTWLGGEVLHIWGGWSTDAARKAVQRLLLSLFAVFFLWRMGKVSSERGLILESGSVFIFLLAVVANQINCWYLTLAVPLVAVLSTPLSRSIVIFLTAWPLACYFRPFTYDPPFWANLARTLLFYGVLLALLLWHSRTKICRRSGQGSRRDEKGKTPTERVLELARPSRPVKDLS